MRIIESGEVLKNDKHPGSARTENRQPICAIACGGLPLKQSVRIRVRKITRLGPIMTTTEAFSLSRRERGG
jgi:hypothetical protein